MIICCPSQGHECVLPTRRYNPPHDFPCPLFVSSQGREWGLLVTAMQWLTESLPIGLQVATEGHNPTQHAASGWPVTHNPPTPHCHSDTQSFYTPLPPPPCHMRLNYIPSISSLALALASHQRVRTLLVPRW